MKLDDLQKLLQKQKTDAYLVTHNNRFAGQDILQEENSILELCGFSGSAGNLLVLQDKAILFVDGRYELQSKLETDPNLIEIICSASPDPLPWMKKYLSKKAKIMYDPWTTSHHELSYYAENLPNIKFIADEKEILGKRLGSRTANVFKHNIEYCGIGKDEKIALVIEEMQKHNLDALMISEADNVSWLLNLRSNALPDTPVFRAYALLDKDASIMVFAENTTYQNALPFNMLKKCLKAYKNKKIGLGEQTPQIIYNWLPASEYAAPSFEIIEKIKSIKNPIELQGMKNAHIRDAIAMVSFLHWLDNNWQEKTELDIIAKLRSFREQQDLFYSDSFPTIAGFGQNGAIIHYHPTEKSNLKLQKDSILLLDSGAQYYDGTTDITRTIAIGTPSTEMINDFTMVLKSHISLADCRFPENTDGKQLDAICRAPTWACGKDYKHGTGHGVGCFLNVHEGPNSISKGARPLAYHPGMITSVEPGYYKENHYGIRIENLVYTAEENNAEFENKTLKFITLTLVPIDKRLINKYLLSQGEIDWLNHYHQKIWNTLKDIIIKEDTLAWLKEACSPL